MQLVKVQSLSLYCDHVARNYEVIFKNLQRRIIHMMLARVTSYHLR
jgi:hypothetical protein